MTRLGAKQQQQTGKQTLTFPKHMMGKKSPDMIEGYVVFPVLLRCLIVFLLFLAAVDKHSKAMCLSAQISECMRTEQSNMSLNASSETFTGERLLKNDWNFYRANIDEQLTAPERDGWSCSQR
ncbi:uncharacterized protein V6R79_002297 [Siganus canaliculatus]